MNSLFIQFDLTLFIKRNVFFMNQYLYNDDYLIWNFGDDDEPDINFFQDMKNMLCMKELIGLIP